MTTTRAGEYDSHFTIRVVCSGLCASEQVVGTDRDRINALGGDKPFRFMYSLAMVEKSYDEA